MILIAFLLSIANADEMDLIDYSKNRLPELKVSARERADFSCVCKSLDAFYADCGRYPLPKEGLKALIEKPQDCNKWRPRIHALPEERWGHAWFYTASENGEDYELKVDSLPPKRSWFEWIYPKPGICITK